MSIKISIFVPTLEAGGAERVAINLSEYMINHGYDIDLVVSRKQGRFVNEVNKNIDIVELPSLRVPLFSLSGTVPGLIYYLKSNDRDVIISLMTHANIVMLLSTLCMSNDTATIISEHNHFSSRINAHTSTRRRFIQRMLKDLYPTADGIVAVSEGVKKDILNNTDIGYNEIAVIHNPIIDKSIFRKAEEEPDHYWLRSDDIRCIVSVGSLTQQKNHKLTIEAFSKIKERNIKLIIVGEGSEEKNIREYIDNLGIQNKVDLIGWVENIYSYMSNADVFVLSSSWEGFGNVIVEALACGCPIVSTDCPSGPSEILQSGKYGYLVPVGDCDALADGIQRVLDEKQDNECLRGRSRDFSKAEIGEEYLNFIYEIYSSGRSIDGG